MHMNGNSQIITWHLMQEPRQSYRQEWQFPNHNQLFLFVQTAMVDSGHLVIAVIKVTSDETVNKVMWWWW